MLVSLTKILLFVAAVVAAIFGIEMLLESGYTLRIAVAGTEFTLGPVQTLIAAAALLLVVWVVIKLIGLLMATVHFLAGDETAITRPGSKGKGPSQNGAPSSNTRTIETVQIAPVNQCGTCGEDLSDTPCQGHERRTRIDIIFELESYAYLHHVLQHIAAADTLGKIEALLPWNMK